MAFQTSVNQSPALGIPGSFSDISPVRDAITVSAEVDSTASAPLEDPLPGILPGHLTMRGTDFSDARLPHALAVDVDAIIATGDSSTTTYSGATLDGAVGDTRWPVPTLIDLVLNSDTDWDDTDAILIGIDGNGAQVTELLDIPNDGGATVTSNARFVQIISLAIPAQTGSGGTFTLGVQGPASGAITKAMMQGFVVNDQHREGTADPNGISVGLEGLPFPDLRGMSAIRQGRFFVRTQDLPLEGAPVWVRVVNSAGAGLPSNIGQPRSDADSGNALLVPGARFRRIENLIAEIEFDARD